MFISAIGDPFSKQREEQVRKSQEDRQKDLKLEADRAERLKKLGTENASEVGEQLGLFD